MDEHLEKIVELTRLDLEAQEAERVLAERMASEIATLGACGYLPEEAELPIKNYFSRMEAKRMGEEKVWKLHGDEKEKDIWSPSMFGRTYVLSETGRIGFFSLWSLGRVAVAAGIMACAMLVVLGWVEPVIFEYLQEMSNEEKLAWKAEKAGGGFAGVWLWMKHLWAVIKAMGPSFVLILVCVAYMDKISLRKPIRWLEAPTKEFSYREILPGLERSLAWGRKRIEERREIIERVASGGDALGAKSQLTGGGVSQA